MKKKKQESLTWKAYFNLTGPYNWSKVSQLTLKRILINVTQKVQSTERCFLPQIARRNI